MDNGKYPLTTAANTSKPLRAFTLGISISASNDLRQRGLSQDELQTALNKIAQCCLARGAILAYGGDLRPGGFTEFLFDLVRTHNSAEQASSERIANYLAWPLYPFIDPQWLAANSDVARIEAISPPRDLVTSGLLREDAPVAPDTPEHGYIWARCLSAMRERMAQDIDARVMLGGKLLNYKGKYPGLVEEALLMLRTDKPLFVLGGFGGACKVMIEALQGRIPETLSTAYQRQDGRYAAMMDFYNEAAAKAEATFEPINYDLLNAELERAGLAGLNNGLSEAENRKLFETMDSEEAVNLVLDGMRRRIGG